jgi:DNA polymerase III epsilon subunit-like protein
MSADPPTFRYGSDIVVIDLEASSPAAIPNSITSSNIIEIGAVRLDRRTLAVVDTFSELVRPRDFPVEPHITEITSITPEMVAGAETFDGVAARFIEWYGTRNRSILAAYGTYYDIPLLRKECDAFGIDFRKHFVGGALDIRSLALAWLAGHRLNTSGLTLQKVLDRMGLGALQLDAHRALDDARGAAAILQFYHRGDVAV